LYGLEEDLNLSSQQFQISVSILFVTYLLFEVPSNLVLKLFTPRLWIAFIAFSWGVIATATGLVESYGSLIACRLLLGVVEAGLFPGLTVYLTFFYTKHELALRVGYLFVSAALAGAVGGLLAYGIGHMEGVQGMRGWRWVFIIEGLPSVVLAVVTFFALPNDAQTAYFLTKEERALMEVRRGREYGSTEQFNTKDMNRAFLDWKVWAFSIAQFGVDTMLYGRTSPFIFRLLFQTPPTDDQTHPQVSQLSYPPSSTAWASGPLQRSSCSLFHATSSAPPSTWSQLSSPTEPSSVVCSASSSALSVSSAMVCCSPTCQAGCTILAVSLLRLGFMSLLDFHWLG
jgi:MFS family permease